MVIVLRRKQNRTGHGGKGRGVCLTLLEEFMLLGETVP